MRAVVQRVSYARVKIGGKTVSEIGPGLLALLGVRVGDAADDARLLARKIAGLRVFDDDAGRLGRSATDIGGGILAVSNFTLYADCSSGRRPDFLRAAPRRQAEPLFDAFCDGLRAEGARVETGVFGADMKVELLNDGPVTLVIDSDALKKKPG